MSTFEEQFSPPHNQYLSGQDERVIAARHIRASNTVYIVGDDAGVIRSMEKRLQSEGYRTRAFNDLPSLREACRQAPLPAAVIMDMIFPEEGGAGGAETLRTLKRDGGGNLPIIFISVRDDLDARLAVLRSGATRYLTKPLNLDRLMAVLDELLLPTSDDPYRVLLVDDDPEQINHLTRLLDDAGMAVRALADPIHTLHMFDEFKPDVVVLDVDMPGCTGMELAMILRERGECAALPILFLSTEQDTGTQMLALELDSDDFLEKPVNPVHFPAAVAARAKRARRLRTLNNTLRGARREQHYQQLSLDQHAIVSKTDTGGRIIHANDRFCEVSGYSRAELLGQNHRLLKSGMHDAAFYENLWNTISTGQVWQGELCNRRKDGSLYWVESTIVPYLDEQGKPYQYVSIRTDITAVKAAGDRLSLLLASSPVVLYSLVPNGENFRTTWVSGNIESLLGYTAAEALVPGWCHTHIHPDDRQSAVRAAADVLHKSEITHEYRFQRKDGSYIHIVDQLRVYRAPSGAISEIIGGWAEVTELRQTQEELRRNETRLRRSQAYANIGTWDWDIQTGDLHWSERIAPLFGYTEGDLDTTYENFLNAVHPDDRQRVVNAVKDCIEKGAEYNIEHRCVWPDGTERWLLERGDVARDTDGTPLHMLGVVQDITQRKEAEIALRASRERLTESQRIAHLGSWEADMVSGELSWSCEVYRIFGQLLGIFMPSYEGFHAMVHPGDRDLVLQSERHARDTGVHDVIHRIIRPDGSIRFVRELAEMTRDAAGNPLRMVGTAQDITTLMETELALIAAKEEAEKANRAKSEFLSSMSHELRTPMNAILGFAQLMEIDKTLTADNREGVDEILKAGRHLLDLINEVLDLSRIESGHLDLVIETVACAGLINECINLVRPLADHSGIDINTDHGACGHLALRADRVRLKQVLLNLLSNAVKYNRPGGSVTVAVQDGGNGMLRLCVTDTGQGIPEHRQIEVFHPFNRLGADKTDAEGTGIGLVISKRLIEMMGGAIDFESVPGEGSSFWIELPMEAPGPARTDTVMHGDTTTAAGPETHTVLYVEDNPTNLKLVAQLLAQRTHIRLLTAHIPELGLDIARAHQPDLILLDISMPGMDGYTLLHELRRLDATRATPMVAITANAMPAEIRRGLDAGFDDYLTKPLDIPRFFATIDRLLTRE